VNVSKLEGTVYHMKFPGPAVHAKQARGAMVRYMAEAAVTAPQGLKGALLPAPSLHGGGGCHCAAGAQGCAAPCPLATWRRRLSLRRRGSRVRCSLPPRLTSLTGAATAEVKRLPAQLVSMI
jgi:hypothetical protein